MAARRKFLKQSGLTLLGAGILNPGQTSPFTIFNRKSAPSDTIRFATIGINGMGWANTRAALVQPKTQLVAICDIDQNVINKRMADLKDLKVDTSKVQTFKDYRKLLELKDLDAIIIGTPDHWHPLITIHGCQAGKDVYVEKPIANSIGESLAMEQAQKKYNRAIQVGQWQRSQKHFRDAIDFVHSGKLGNIRTSKAWAYQGWMKPAPVVPDSTPPEGVDYDMWQGPALKRPFNTSHFHFNFRWFWPYAGGLMCDWGVHLIDYALFGMKATMPKTVASLGGKFAYPELSHETPDSQHAIYEFDKFILSWEHAMSIDNGPYGRDHGISFIGNNGTLILDRGGWEVIEEKREKDKILIPYQKREDNGVEKHMENFFGVVRSRKMEDLNASIQVGSLVAKVCQMGNIAFRSQKKLNWDATTQQFTDEQVNKEYLMPAYHNGYNLPMV